MLEKGEKDQKKDREQDIIYSDLNLICAHFFYCWPLYLDMYLIICLEIWTMRTNTQ